MTDNETPPIVVSGNAATTDPLKLAIANVFVILGAMTALAGFVSNRDLAGFIVWIKTTDGAAFIGAVMTVASLGYAAWKSRHRATQVVTLGADPRVPATVAVVKGTAA